MSRHLVFCIVSYAKSLCRIFVGNEFTRAVAFYLMITTTSSLIYDGWNEITKPPLPRTMSSIAIGHDISNHTIWLIGPRQLSSFDYTTNTFEDHGSSFFSNRIHGYGQNYAQIGNLVYCFDANDVYIVTFNVQTMIFTEDALLQPYNVFERFVCMVNIRDQYIAVFGLQTNVSIFNIETQYWLDSVPSLQVSRSSSSCIYIHDKMFIVGGDMLSSGSIEYLDVSSTSMMNISSKSWQYTNQSLPHDIMESRCVAVNDDILVIGGRPNSVDYNMFNTIYVIDSITLSVSLGGYLSKAIAGSAVIFVNDIIYSFGGNVNNGETFEPWDGWQMKAGIPTPNSSTAPSQAPIIAVTLEPSISPTNRIMSSTTTTRGHTDDTTTIYNSTYGDTSIQTSVDTINDGSTNAPFEYTTTDAIVSSYQTATEEQTNLMQTISTFEKDKTTNDSSNEPSVSHSLSLSPIVYIIIGLSLVCVLCIVYVLKSIYKQRVIKKRVQKMSDIVQGDDIKADNKHNDNPGYNLKTARDNRDNQEEELKVTSEGDKEENDEAIQEQWLQMTVEGNEEVNVASNIGRHSESDSSDHNNDDLWVEQQEGDEERQITTDCTVKDPPKTVTGGFFEA